MALGCIVQKADVHRGQVVAITCHDTLSQNFILDLWKVIAKR